MTDKPTLLPCPFCGADDAFTERADFSSSYVVCNNCIARGPTECQDSDDEDEPGQASAITAWNTRPTPPTLAGDVERDARLYPAALKQLAEYAELLAERDATIAALTVSPAPTLSDETESAITEALCDVATAKNEEVECAFVRVEVLETLIRSVEAGVVSPAPSDESVVETAVLALCKARGENPEGCQVRFVDGDAHSATFLDIARHDTRTVIAAAIAAGAVSQEPLRQWRCVECKIVFGLNLEPDRCPNCSCRTFAEIAPTVSSQEPLRRALELQEAAEHENANCPECEGEGNWAQCERCAPLFGAAIDARHQALTIAPSDGMREALVDLMDAVQRDGDSEHGIGGLTTIAMLRARAALNRGSGHGS